MALDDTGNNESPIQLVVDAANEFASNLKDLDRRAELGEPDVVSETKNILIGFATKLRDSEEISLSSVASDYLEFREAKDTPPGVLFSVTSDYKHSFENILNLLGIPPIPSLRHNMFYVHYPEVHKTPNLQSPLLDIYITPPQHPDLMRAGGIHRSFQLLSAVLLHTNIGKNTLPQVLAIISMSLISDFYKLQLDMQSKKVEYRALNNVYDAILERANARGDFMNDLMANSEKATKPDKLPNIEDFYIGNISNQN